MNVITPGIAGYSLDSPSARHPKRKNGWGVHISERLRAYSKKDANGCWIWLRHCNDRGYPTVAIGGRSKYAHRVSYETFVGEITEGMTVDHTCFVTRCVNPDHLRLLTHEENSHVQRRRFKTHCHLGHPYSGSNLKLQPHRKYRGGIRRVCVACSRIHSARRAAK